MELEVGMYVKTKDGIIDKCIDVRYSDNYNTEVSIILLEKTKGYIKIIEHDIERNVNGDVTKINNDIDKYYFPINSILKFSKDIIDLIEVGDIVLCDYYNGNKLLNDCLVLIDKHNIHDISNWIIKEICTKESFESVSYKLGKED